MGPQYHILGPLFSSSNLNILSEFNLVEAYNSLKGIYPHPSSEPP